MTRGQIAIIANENEVSTSTEFNGDMYMPTDTWAGYGKDVIDLLSKVNSPVEYRRAVDEFNRTHHNYPDARTYDYVNERAKEMLDMSEKTYFDKWFSDYVYIKNISGQDVSMIDYDGKDVIIKAGQIAVFNFGTPILVA